MRAYSRFLTIIAVSIIPVLAAPARAETAAGFLRSFETAARQDNADFTGFSARRGQDFFTSTHGREWSCASCHTRNPATPGRHATTDKSIAPLAPAANPGRFRRARKVEKWFRRNCNDVVGRTCTPLEKGDVLTYLLSIK